MRFSSLASITALACRRSQLLPCSQARNACAAAGPDRGSIGASCGRDRALARPVEHSMGTERSHQPEADALARCPAIHRALPGDGRPLSVGQITGEEMDQKPRNRQTVGLRPRAGDSRSALGQPSSSTRPSTRKPRARRGAFCSLFAQFARALASGSADFHVTACTIELATIEPLASTGVSASRICRAVGPLA